MSIKSPHDNGRSCNAVTKYRSYIAVCDKELDHAGDHQATLANAEIYSWSPEPW